MAISTNRRVRIRGSRKSRSRIRPLLSTTGTSASPPSATDPTAPRASRTARAASRTSSTTTSTSRSTSAPRCWRGFLHERRRSIARCSRRTRAACANGDTATRSRSRTTTPSSRSVTIAICAPRSAGAWPTSATVSAASRKGSGCRKPPPTCARCRRRATKGCASRCSRPISARASALPAASGRTRAARDSTRLGPTT